MNSLGRKDGRPEICERNPARSFKELTVWQKAHQFVLAAYKFTRSFPEDEKYGLTSQLRRAAASVPANIAEGFTRRGRSGQARFFNISQASLQEAHYYLILAQDLGYGENSQLLMRCEETARLLNAYTTAVLRSDSQLRTPNS